MKIFNLILLSSLLLNATFIHLMAGRKGEPGKPYADEYGFLFIQ